MMHVHVSPKSKLSEKQKNTKAVLKPVHEKRANLREYEAGRKSIRKVGHAFVAVDKEGPAVRLRTGQVVHSHVAVKRHKRKETRIVDRVHCSSKGGNDCIQLGVRATEINKSDKHRYIAERKPGLEGSGINRRQIS